MQFVLDYGNWKVCQLKANDLMKERIKQRAIENINHALLLYTGNDITNDECIEIILNPFNH